MKENRFSKVKKTRNITTHTSLETRKHPGGRPKKSEEEKRKEIAFTTLTKAEKEVLDKKAAEQGLSGSVFIRQLLFKEIF